MARFFDGEFADELKVVNKSVVEYRLGRNESGVSLLSLPIKIAEFDLHLIDIRHRGISRFIMAARYRRAPRLSGYRDAERRGRDD